MSDSYSISIYSIQTNNGRVCVGKETPESDISILSAIHSDMNTKYVSSGRKERLFGRFDGNLFFCCLNSGAALFSFVPDKNTVSMAGIFIQISDLRTAWKLFIPYLINFMLMIKEIPFTGAYELSFEDFRDEISSKLLSRGSRNAEYAAELIKKVRTHTVPFNFCASRLPTSMITGDFENLVQGSADDASDKIAPVLTFDREAVMTSKTRLMKTNRETMEIRFCRTSAKRFKDLRKNEIKAKCEKPFQKEMLKEIDNFDDDLEYVWYFSYSGDYFIPIENSEAHLIESLDGMIPFELLYQQMAKANEKMIKRKIEYKSGKQKPKIIQPESIDEFEARMGMSGSPFSPDQNNATSGNMSSVTLNPITKSSQTDISSKNTVTPDEPDKNDKKFRGPFGLFRKK